MSTINFYSAFYIKLPCRLLIEYSGRNNKNFRIHNATPAHNIEQNLNVIEKNNTN